MAFLNNDHLPGVFKNITTATTTVVKAGPGVLNTLTINKLVASATVTIYDNTAASGTVIGTITLPATLLAEGPVSAIYNVAFETGLTVVTVGAQDITVSYN